MANFQDMNQGKIIEYIDQGKLISGLCLQDKGNKLHLLTIFNREVNLSPKRALLISNSSLNTLNPREELLQHLRQAETLRNTLKDQVHVKDLWELIMDEDESFDYTYLAQLSFGEEVTDDHISALVRALFEDRLYFKIKDGRFHPNSEERVAQIAREREEQARREAVLKEGSVWLKGVIQDKPVQDPSCKEEILALLTDLALYGNEAPHLKYGKELLSAAGISDIGESRALLVKLGVWEEDENLDLHRLNIRTSFSESQTLESEQLAKARLGDMGREDLRHLPTLTIDGPLTRDFDDALSLELEDNSIVLGVHIADVAGVVPPGCTIDRESLQRGSSLYLPRHQIPMLPPTLSQNILSLKEGCDRPALSMIARLDKSANLLSHRFVPSIIRVQRQLTYDGVNDIYRQDEVLEHMVELSQLMRQKRVDQGALILSLPEVLVQIDPDSTISLAMIEQETPSRTMVAEFMIFYNWLAARFCKDNQIPILYRGQEEPSERLSAEEAGYIYFVFKQRRKLNPLMVDTEPIPHKGLGLDVYTNASSPIRRYLDLVIQRQIRNFLFNESLFYDRDELEKIRTSVQPVLKDLERAKRNRIRYWIQKYLSQHSGEKFSAIVLDILKGKYRVLLTDFLLVAEMKGEDGLGFSGGQRITVKVKKVDPWNDLLTLEYAGQKGD